MAKEIQDRASFNLIRYSNCWEDADVLCEALQPAQGKRFLSIASAGDNSFSLIAHGASVVAADLSTSQLACVELRMAAFRNLSYNQLLAFLGVRPGDDQIETFRRIESDLSDSARSYWNAHLDSIAGGFIHVGKFEAYFRKFRTYALPLVHSRKKVHALLQPKSLEEQAEFYDRQWDTVRWRMLFRVFFSKFVMGRLGRDPEFFRYVEGSVADRILLRTRHALTQLSTARNPYLNYILTGNYGDALPHYLRESNFENIRDGLDRLTLFEGPIQEAAEKHREEGFDGFNLSDIFEYMDDSLCHSIYEQLLSSGKSGARFAYWNMLVPRACPPSLRDSVVRLDSLGDRLLEQDRAWFYSKFVVEEKK